MSSRITTDTLEFQAILWATCERHTRSFVRTNRSHGSVASVLSHTAALQALTPGCGVTICWQQDNANPLLTVCERCSPPLSSLCVCFTQDRSFLVLPNWKRSFLLCWVKYLWQRRVLLRVHLCEHTARPEEAHSWLSIPEKADEPVRGDKQSLGMEKLSTKTSPGHLTLWLLPGENESGVKIPYAIFSKCTAKSRVAFVLHPISLRY